MIRLCSSGRPPDVDLVLLQDFGGLQFRPNAALFAESRILPSVRSERSHDARAPSASRRQIWAFVTWRIIGFQRIPRAAAAYLARRRFGYSTSETAAALGYREHSGVGRAIRRVEQGTANLQRTVKHLENQLTTA
jgi:hypothetical protein